MRDEDRRNLTADVQVRSLEEAQTHIASLSARLRAVECELRCEAEKIDTLWTPWWKKVWFAINGWPLYRLADAPKHRPWHRWTGV